MRSCRCRYHLSSGTGGNVCRRLLFLCGYEWSYHRTLWKSRPIHFRGVQTVVLKLFHIVTPDRAYFGQKDAQQLAVIRRMVKDLNVDTRIIGCPIIREADGLAKSSRNTYLNAEERQAALVLSRSLKAGKALVDAGETRACVIKSAITAEIEKSRLPRLITWMSLTLTPLLRSKNSKVPFL